MTPPDNKTSKVKTSMSGARKTVFDTVIYGIQGALPQILSLLLLPIFTRVLTRTDYGVVNLVAAFSAIVSGFIALQLPSSIGRFFFDYKKSDLASYFTTILVFSCCVGAAFVVIIFAAGDTLVTTFYPKAQIPFYPLFFLSMISTWMGVIVNSCSIMLQVERKASVLLRNSLMMAVVQASVSFFLVVILRWGPLGVILAGTISAFVNVCSLLWLVRGYLSCQLNFSVLRPSMAYGLPLIPHFFGSFLFTSSDLIVLEKYTDLAAVGLYAVSVRLAGPLSICVEAFNRANSPHFIQRSMVSKTETALEYKTLITKWLAIALFGWIGVSLFAREVLTVLVPANFHGAADFIPILAASYIFRGLYCFSVNGLFFEKKTNWIPMITLTSGVVNVALNIALIPVLGVIAAAWTTLFSFALSFAIALVLSNRIYPLQWETGKLVALFAISIPIVIIMETLPPLDHFWTKIFIKSVILLAAGSLLFWLGGFFGTSPKV